jgi:phosphohistidine swiveling domain-containing protein
VTFTLGYFGVFLVAPLTALLVALLAGALVVVALTTALGLDSTGSQWRVVALPLAAMAAGLSQGLERLRARVAPPAMIALRYAGRPAVAHLVGPKAAGVARVTAAGFATARGFVVTAPTTLKSRRLRWGLAAQLRALEASRLVVRSSFAGEDTETTSAAGLYHSETDVPATVEAVLAAIRAVRDSGDGAVLIQRRVDCVAWGVAASIDPRTGFAEHSLVQRGVAPDTADTVYVVDHLVGQPDPAALAARRLAQIWGGPVEIEVGWTRQSPIPVVFQCRPLLGIPTASTWVNGGAAALPTVPLSPAARAWYVGEGIAARLRRALEPIGLEGPADADVIEHEHRFYLRYRPTLSPIAGGSGRLRWLRAAIGLGPRDPDPRIQGARAGVLAAAWLGVAEGVATVPAEVLASLERGVQPVGRPDVPEELLDPGYDSEWPAWTPPPCPAIPANHLAPARRLAWRFALRRYRRWLVERFAQREAALVANKAHRDQLSTPDPTALAAWQTALAAPAPPAVLHPGATGAPQPGSGGRWGPAVPGVAVALLAYDEPGPGTESVILVLPDSRGAHAHQLARCAGLVIDRAGPLSHLVLLAREQGIPTVVGPRPEWPAGTLIELDGSQGTLEPCSRS